MSMDAIPKALQYGAVSNSSARVVRQKIQPLGVSSGSSGTTVRFLLPQKSIIDMRSLSFYYNYAITGLTANDTNNSYAQLSPSYQHWSSIKFFVSGASAAGSQCNHYNMVHHALLKASAGGQDYCNSRLNNGYDQLLVSPGLSNTVANGATGLNYDATLDDIVLFRSKNYCYDASLFGNLEVELTFADRNIIKAQGLGTFIGAALPTAVNHAFSNIVLAVDTVVSISPLYVSLLAERLQVAQPIRMPFSEIRSVQTSTTGSNRITLQSACVDSVLVAFKTTANDTAATYSNAAVQAIASVPAFTYGVSDSANMGFQLTIGSETFPRQAVSKLGELLDCTTNAMYGNDARSTNLLYHGVAAGVSTYSLANAANNGAIAITKFAVGEEGWATGLLCGLQTNGIATDCVVASNSANSSRMLIAVMQTSQVVFDPQTSAVSIEA